MNEKYWETTINPYPAKLIYLNFQPLEAVDRGSETQPQVVENYWYLFNLGPNIYIYLTQISFPISVLWSPDKTG